MGAAINFEELRKRKRFSINQTIICYKHVITKADRQAPKAPFKITVLDLSFGGVKVITKRELRMGDVLMFNLQNGNQVKPFMMEVVWCRYDGDFLAGLKFINLTKDMIMFLNALIKDYVEREERVKKYK